MALCDQTLILVYLLDNMIPRYATGNLEQKLQLML